MLSETIGQKIIGHHRIGAGGGRLRRGSLLWAKNADFALTDQPLSEHGCSVFIEPLIEKRRDLLAEIGGVAETREFLALEGVARSCEKELPRGLGTRDGQRGLLKYQLPYGAENHTTSPRLITSNCTVTGLWKSVENSENPWRAYSGCAGDYEDPERTAWVEIEDENEEGGGEDLQEG